MKDYQKCSINLNTNSSKSLNERQNFTQINLKQGLTSAEDLKEEPFHLDALNFDKNHIPEKELDDFNFEQNNDAYIYYCSTIECLKKKKMKKNGIKFSKNFIPKNKNDIIQNADSLDNSKICEDINSFINNIKNFKDCDYKPKQILEKENKSCSTISKASSTYSDQLKKTNISFSINKIENKKHLENEELSECDYLVEMFGKKGWICLLCNNFNYETRIKCNRCGVMKKPKIIINKKLEIEKKLCENKIRTNRIGDWFCRNCKNLNYSFRTTCNRCKLPRIFLLINNSVYSQSLFNQNVNNFPIYCTPSPFIVYNNLPYISINHINNNL